MAIHLPELPDSTYFRDHWLNEWAALSQQLYSAHPHSHHRPKAPTPRPRVHSCNSCWSIRSHHQASKTELIAALALPEAIDQWGFASLGAGPV